MEGGGMEEVPLQVALAPAPASSEETRVEKVVRSSTRADTSWGEKGSGSWAL
jgi:hypothetical protein